MTVGSRVPYVLFLLYKVRRSRICLFYSSLTTFELKETLEHIFKFYYYLEQTLLESLRMDETKGALPVNSPVPIRCKVE